MKIKSEDFIRNSGIINEFYNSSLDKYRSITIDFSEGYYYLTGISNTYARFKFDIEEFEDLNLVFDSKKFLALCGMYEEIELLKIGDADYTFIVQEEEFKLEHFTDVFFNKEIFNKEQESVNTVIVDSELYSVMKKSTSYIGSQISLINHVINITNNIAMFRSESNDVYFNKLSKEYKNFTLTKENITFIEKLGIGTEINEYKKTYRLIKDDGIIFMPKVSFDKEAGFGELQGKVFTELYSHPNSYFTINKGEFESVLKSLSPFLADVINSSLYFHVENDNLFIEVKSNDHIKMKLKVYESALDDDFEFILDLSNISKHLKILEGEEITLQVSNKMVINPRGTEIESSLCNIFTDSNESEHMVFFRLRDNVVS